MGRTLRHLGLEGKEEASSHHLSYGERKRVALATVLSMRPEVVALDEPFSNLDVEVRLRLRAELPGVLARCGAGGLMVTHDPDLARQASRNIHILDGRASDITPDVVPNVTPLEAARV